MEKINKTPDQEDFINLLHEMGVFGYSDTPVAVHDIKQEFLHVLMDVLVEEVNTNY